MTAWPHKAQRAQKRKGGMLVNRQHPLTVRDEDGTVLGDYVADLIVKNCMILELKACRALAAEHTAQVPGYLRALEQRHAQLIIFGSPRTEIKKFNL